MRILYKISSLDILNFYKKSIKSLIIRVNSDNLIQIISLKEVQ